jgi:hypothetical protein
MTVTVASQSLFVMNCCRIVGLDKTCVNYAIFMILENNSENAVSVALWNTDEADCKTGKCS